MRQELELLAPAGSFETLKAVIQAGADAVYAGGDMFGARAYAKNFSKEDVLEAIDYVHMHKKKMMLTVNTLLKNKELETGLYDYILPFYEQGLNAVIVQDFGVLSFLHRNFPNLSLHTSTQMTITDAAGAKFLAENGASRIVGARELSLKELKHIYDETGMEIESFIHGALCYCYSGQCLFSSILGGRSGNRGRCAQPCRLPYSVSTPNQIRGKQELPILSLKDLCTIDFIPQLAQSGVYSFKIEGRMKQTEYAMGVVSIYRKYMDMYLQNGEKSYEVSKKDREYLLNLGNRSGFTNGYYFEKNDSNMITYEKPSHMKNAKQQQEEIQFAKGAIENKINIHGILTMQVGKSAILEVFDDDSYVKIEGSMTQQAQNKPLMAKDVEAKLRKTGTTMFEFDTIQMNLEPNVFLPIQEINHMRREALETFATQKLEGFRRVVASKSENTKEAIQEYLKSDRNQPKGNPKLNVSVESKEAFDTILTYDFVQSIYVDSMMFEKSKFQEQLLACLEQAQARKKKLYLVLPYICRQTTSGFYGKILKELDATQLDGYVIKSYDELGLYEQNTNQSKEVLLDHNMYTYSDEAQYSFAQNNYRKNTVPFELNKKELSHRYNQNSEMVIYGYIPLMVSAQCVHKNMASCDKKSGISYLKDRYDKDFFVRNNCRECYNVIYNSSPLFLLHQKKELDRMKFLSYRMMFTKENKQQISNQMRLFQKAFIENQILEEKEFPEDFTNGHFKRGVE